MHGTDTPFCAQISKPWGREMLTTPPDLPYAGKLLFVHAGKRLSLQYHDEKEETICLLEGEAALWIGEVGALTRVPMLRHAGYTIHPGQLHRIEAITDCLLTEASTPERGTTVRIEDDYARGTETDDDRRRERTEIPT